MHANMALQDNLHFDAQPRLVSGIQKVALAVGPTMGTGGGNSILEVMENPGHIITNDGYSIANSIMLADPIEHMGRNLLLEAINRANKGSGDGSSTTCVLTAAIIEEGLKYVSEAHPMDIKRSLEACIPVIEGLLEAQARTITTDDVGQVATISAEDADIGAMLQDIYKQIGKDGLVYWDISKTSKDTYTIGTGITVDGAGFQSPYMCDASEGGQNTNSIRIKDPHILITKQKITSAGDFNAVGAYLFGKDIKDLVVFADEVDPLVIPDIIQTRMVRGFRIAIVKMPVLWKDWWYEDLALATGATAIDPAAGLPMRDWKAEHLGTVSNIVITKDTTFVDGIKDVSAHVAALKEQKEDDADLRAARLNIKTARYFVGAHTDSALSYRRLKVEDAIASAYQALNGGIVAGGGSALVQVADSLTLDNIGANILLAALRTPAKQIAANAGHPAMDIGKDYANGMGFDTKAGRFVNMFDAGIIDPKNVVFNAIKNAISVAATVLTAKSIVTLPRMPEDPNALSRGNLAIR